MKLTGTVQRITYQSDNFVVTRLLPESELLEVTIVGPLNGETVCGVYLAWLHRAEVRAAANLRRLLTHPVSRLGLAFAHTDWHDALAEVEEATGIALAEGQARAVRIALRNKVTILTGGPGTGKTTTIRSILHLLNEVDANVRLAAPTGRAARRVSEATGVEAVTIHRLLEATGEGQFNRNEDNPIGADMVIVDEMSMVDLPLFDALLRAISPETHLLLVGDPDQIPSVGPGDVLGDLIRSGIVPVVHLDVVFRQAEQSAIITNAHRINRGEMPVFSQDSPGGRQDVYWFGLSHPQEVADMIVDLVSRRIPDRFGFRPGDIQVLSPMRRGVTGVNELNARLQEVLNPQNGQEEHRVGSVVYRVGDRLMQTRNDYDRQVFNGDVGTLVALDGEEGTAVVEFEGRYVRYATGDLRDLVLAYAITIHKSQGSEYPVVVIPVTTQHYVMLVRNLIYTAVTRARQMVVMVGTKKALAMAVRNNQTSRRWSGLAWRLADCPLHIRLSDGP